MSDAILVLEAGALFTPFEKLSPARVVVRGERIEAIGAPGDVRVPDHATRILAPDLTLVPGFIEPHVHGCGGHDVMQATAKSMEVICRTLARFGTTSFLPTTVSAPVDDITNTLEGLTVQLRTRFSGAQPLGIHLEGPFLSVRRRGTHQAACILPPSGNQLLKWIQHSDGLVKLVTMAPEVEGATTAADIARERGVVVGMGHSDATYAQAIAAVDSGTHYAVHTFNAMRPLSHRDPGIVGAVLADDRVFAEIIADGVHVAPEVVRIFARAKGPTRIVLATDATSATGMPDGSYALGQSMVEVRGGVCRDTEGHLAGSTLTQDRALRNLLEWTGMRLEDALQALTSNPAAALSIADRGQLRPGAFADFVLLDSRLNVVRTYVGGTVAFDREN